MPKHSATTKQPLSFKLKMRRTLVGLVLILVLFSVVEWLAQPDSARTPPASHNDLINAAKTLRQIPYQASSTDTKRLVALGKKFFFDPGFSKNKNIACASCHDPKKSFTDGKRVSIGMSESNMNAPTLINVRNSHWFFHNGRADSLEMQAPGPVENPLEHGFTRVDIASTILQNFRAEYEAIFGPLPHIQLPESSLPSNKPVYVSDAVAAYVLGTLGSAELQKDILGRAHDRGIQPIRIIQEDSAGLTASQTPFDRSPPATQAAINQMVANFSQAIAAFERTIHTQDSPFDLFADRFVASGNAESAFVEGFGPSEFKGLQTFAGEGRCMLCHQGPDLTDHQFHNIGLPALSAKSVDLGRAQGILLAKNGLFNCDGLYFKQLNSGSESCGEMQFVESENSELVGAFKTPTLRNLRDTAPYGHDGRFPTIKDVLIHYTLLPGKPAVGHIEESLRPLRLSDTELADLEAFLNSLYGQVVSD